MKIKTSKITKILTRDVISNKLLSPNIIKFKKKFILFYSKRIIDRKKYAEINNAESTDLTSWKINSSFKINPLSIDHFSNGLLSPCFFKLNEKNYILTEAQNNNESEIILLTSDDLFNWKLKNKFCKKEKDVIFQSPYFFNQENIFKVFYTKNRTEIYSDTINENFEIIKTDKLFESSYDNENFCIYSPSIVKLKEHYYMFYSAWSNNVCGNINVAMSKDLLKWQKIKKNIFEVNSNYQIISEPSVIDVEENLHIFFEYKNKSGWDLGYTKLKIENFLDSSS